MSFKQEVALALLQNTEWMPKFSKTEDAAFYVSEPVPENTRELLALQRKLMAVLVAEFAEEIAHTVGE